MELHNNIKVSRAISPAAAITDNTPWVSQILDTANFHHNELLLALGSLADADATFTLLMENGEQANLSDAAAIPDDELLGTESQASFTFGDDDETRKIGYIGKKRYIRATVTPANNSGNAFLSGLWLQSEPRKAPVA